MKTYTELMTNLIGYRTLFIDLKHRALKNNDIKMYYRYETKVQEVEKLMEEIRDKFMQW